MHKKEATGGRTGRSTRERPQAAGDATQRRGGSVEGATGGGACDAAQRGGNEATGGGACDAAQRGNGATGGEERHSAGDGEEEGEMVGGKKEREVRRTTIKIT